MQQPMFLVQYLHGKKNDTMDNGDFMAVFDLLFVGAIGS
jgi:hypothetical protein